MGNEGKCIKCGDPVHVAPNGRVAKLCSICIFQAFSVLGIVDQSSHLTRRAAELPSSADAGDQADDNKNPESAIG